MNIIVEPPKLEPVAERDGDVCYPIFSFSFRWSEEGVWDPKYPNWYEGLPEGRVWNGTWLSKMYREEPTFNQLIKDAQEAYAHVADKRTDECAATIADEEIKVQFLRSESWCQGWFSHHTFDVGQSDEEALATFQRYVDRYEHMQEWGYERDGDDPNYICLMGAEDRWRWKAAEDGEPPCRCEHCKAQGILRIGH